MRVLIISHPCATPTNQDGFAVLAERSGWDVTILAPTEWRTEYGTTRTQRSPRFTGGLELRGASPVGNIPLHAYRMRLGALVRRIGPDVVYVHHEPYAAATAQALFAVGRTSGGPMLGFYSAQNLDKRFPPPFRWTERAVYRRAAFAAPVSEAVDAVLRARGWRGLSRPIPLGVDLASVSATRRSPSDGEMTVGYVGRLSEEKGVDLVLHALALSQSCLRAVIAGDGPEAADLRQLAGDLGVADRVEFLGYVPHDRVAEAYERMDVLAVPSRTTPGWTEQFGRVVIEALASGVPVVAADSGELPQLLGQLGGGWIVQEDDARDLAATLDRLARDPQARLETAQRGEAAVRSGYSLEAVADCFRDLVEDAKDQDAVRRRSR